MKYLILEVAGSTYPVYLNVDKIVSFTNRSTGSTGTVVKLDNGTELLTAVPAAMVHERIEQLLRSAPLVGVVQALEQQDKTARQMVQQMESARSSPRPTLWHWLGFK